MSESYPKYQYSVFTNDPKNGQLVIRADDFDELLTAKRDIDKILNKIEAKEVAIVPPVTRPIIHTEQKPIAVTEFEDACEKCGSPKGTSKKGNRYCLAKCWLKEK